MQSSRWQAWQWIGLVWLGAVGQAHAGQTPGLPSPWNGPWGGGFLNGESYSPLANPYIGAGYPIAAPMPYGGPAQGGYPMPASSPLQAQPRYLPGGGFLLPPGAGGGMMPGAYANH